MRLILSDTIRILGIDPGSRLTGFGVLDFAGGNASYVASGTVKSVSGDFPDRLKQIFESVSSIVDEHRPQVVAIESVFMHKNAGSALKLGQARSAALCATFAYDVEVFEYAPREIKQAVVGTGSATKEQVQHMVVALLKLQGAPAADAADALAAALCHGHQRRLQSQLMQPARRTMIGSLRGRLTFKQAPAIIIECHGVGYDVETPMSTFFELPAVGEELFLYTHLLVREDAQILYGFATEEERALFRTLLRVRGVGARDRPGHPVVDVCRGLRALYRIRGHDGIVEDSGHRQEDGGTPDRGNARSRCSRGPGTVVKIHVQQGAKSEAFDALVALGYKPAEINRLLGKLDIDGQSAEDIIRLALRQAAG